VTYAGTFHVATGTWTRTQPISTLLGGDVIYNNTANSGTFSSGGFELEPVVFETVDAGRVPSSSGPGNRDRYNINCITLSYCLADDALAVGPLEALVRIYNRYPNCSDPREEGTVVGTALVTNMPGWSGPDQFACWTVDLDLSGGSEICLTADGEGMASTEIVDDQFGIGLTMDPSDTGGYRQAGVVLGPVIAGNRDWTAGAPGEHSTSSIAGTGGGGGTYYGPAEFCPVGPGSYNSSGFDTEDTWWVTDRPNLPSGGGPAIAQCYWFGGYNGASGCTITALNNLPAALWMVLQADSTTDCVEVPLSGGVGDSFCNPASPNSNGVSALATARVIAPGVPGLGLGLALEAEGGPAGEVGYFLVGTSSETVAPIAIGAGNLCLSTAPGEMIGRYNVFGGALNSMGQFDAFGLFRLASTNDFGFEIPDQLPFTVGVSITAGSTWHFQLWHRDASPAGSTSNFSSGVSLTF